MAFGIYLEGSRRSAVNRMFPIWKSKGYKVLQTPQEANVRLAIIKITKNYKIPTIVRIDGVYYDKDENYKSRNINAFSQSIVKCHGIVFQSEFSKNMFSKYVDIPEDKEIRVIHNGIFKINGSYIHDDFNIVICAKWRRFKRLPEIINIFKKFAKIKQNVYLHVIGPMMRGAYEIPCNKVIYHGAQKFDQIKKLLSNGNLSIHLAKRDSCPSSVVEAIGAGMPVITTTLCGGATEMCSVTNGCKIIDEGEIDFTPASPYGNEFNQVSSDVEEQIINEMVQIYEDRRRVEIPKVLKIKYVANKYLEFLKWASTCIA